MKIDIKEKNNEITIILEGRLDTNTSPYLETKYAEYDNIEKLILDFKKLDYISSAGLRILLGMQKDMNNHGEMKIINVNKDVMDIFEITGFKDILNIK